MAAPFDRTRFVQIAGLLASGHAGERDNALSLANKMLAASRLTWADALGGPDGAMQTRLLLPRAAAASGKTASPTDRRDEGNGHSVRTVLVVEDDPDVRNITVARLGEFGHHVLEADNAKAALDILGRGDAIDLLFTDIAMPGGMNGLELARRALQLRPDIRVLFVSGYTSSAHTEGNTPGEFLQKPYRQEDLGRALHRALYRGTTAAA